MKELKEIYHESSQWEERRFQLVKELCSAAVIKDGFTKIRGSHVQSIISVADAIIEKLYIGDELLKSEKIAKINEAFGNADGKLGAFDYETELKPLIQEATQVEINEAEWNRDGEQTQLDFLKTQMLDKSALLPECTHVFVRLSYLSNEDLPGDIKTLIHQSAPAAKCTVLTERGGYSRNATLVTIK